MLFDTVIRYQNFIKYKMILDLLLETILKIGLLIKKRSHRTARTLSPIFCFYEYNRRIMRVLQWEI